MAATTGAAATKGPSCWQQQQSPALQRGSLLREGGRHENREARAKKIARLALGGEAVAGGGGCFHLPPAPDASVASLCFASSVRSCVKAQRWSAALSMLTEARGVGLEGLEANHEVYNSVFSACGKAARWSQALACLSSSMARRGLEPTAVTLGALSLACERGLQWSETLALLSLGRQSGLLGPPLSHQARSPPPPPDPASSSSRWLAPRGGSGGQLAMITASVRSCEIQSQWLKALDLLPEMLTSGRAYAPNLLSFTAGLRVCESGRLGHLAIQLLQDLRKQSLEPSTISYNAALSVCASSLLWQMSLQVLGQVHCSQLEVNTVTGTSAIRAFGNGPGQSWATALGLLNSLQARSLESNEKTCAAALRACVSTSGGVWPSALACLNDMLEGGGPSPNHFCCAAGINVCSKELRWDSAMELLRWARRSGGKLEPDIVAHNAVANACLVSRRWQEANLLLVQDLACRGLQLDEFSLVMALGACRQSQRWESVLRLLDRKSLAGVSRAIAVCNAAATAYVAAQQWTLALDLLAEGPLRFWKAGSRPRQPLSPISVGVALSAFSAGQLWEASLSLLRRAKKNHLRLSAELCGSAMHACISADKARDIGTWRHALALLIHSETEGFDATQAGRQSGPHFSSPGDGASDGSRSSSSVRSSQLVELVNTAMDLKGSEWQLSVGLLNRALRRRLQVDNISCNTAVSSCQLEGKWPFCLELLMERRRHGCDTDIIGWNSCLSGCQRDGLWPEALRILGATADVGSGPNIVSYNSAITVCHQARQWSAAVQLLQDAHREQLRTDATSFQCATAACSREAWEMTLQLLLKSGEQCQVMVSGQFDMAMVACAVNDQSWQFAMQLLMAQRRNSFVPNEIAFHAAIEVALRHGAVSTGSLLEAPSSMVESLAK